MSAYIDPRLRVDRHADLRSTFDPEGMAAFLRGLHPANTAANVAAEIDWPSRTVENWLQLKTLPRADALLRLGDVYGPSFFLAAYHNPPRWLDAVARAQEISALEAEQARIEGALAALRGGA